MKDSLENFISQNREAFDQEVPNLRVWAEIDKKMAGEPEKGKRRTMWRYAWRTAAAVLLLTTGALIGLKVTQNSFENQLATTNGVAKEYLEMETHYKSQVNQKVALLANYNEDSSINEDLQQIDEFLIELKNELKTTPKGSEEQIINAMINNYQTKLAILEKVLERIQSTNQETINKTEENERIDI